MLRGLSALSLADEVDQDAEPENTQGNHGADQFDGHTDAHGLHSLDRGFQGRLHVAPSVILGPKESEGETDKDSKKRDHEQSDDRAQDGE